VVADRGRAGNTLPVMTLLRRVGLLVALLLGLGGAGLTPAATATAPTPCFGAAAMDPSHPCTNPSLSVVPSVADRLALTASGCRKTAPAPGVDCEFGTRSSRPHRTIALVGDSHALHWRGPLAIVARALRWRAYSLWSPLCLLSTTAKYMEPIVRPKCLQWNRDVRRFLARHREISTVFISQAVFIPLFPPPGRSAFAAKVAGFTGAWATLPKTVRHIVVIRDVPGTADETFDCVARVVAAAGEQAGTACREDRRAVLPADPAMTAARLARTRRVQPVDMTRWFCDAQYCYPVIGGVLVHRDRNHMTIDYARTLGPFLLREVRRLMAAWS
jgi:hypothetical protein